MVKLVARTFLQTDVNRTRSRRKRTAVCNNNYHRSCDIQRPMQFTMINILLVYNRHPTRRRPRLVSVTRKLIILHSRINTTY